MSSNQEHEQEIEPPTSADDHRYMAESSVEAGQKEMLEVMDMATLKVITASLGLRFSTLRKGPQCRFLVEVGYWYYASTTAYEEYKEAIAEDGVTTAGKREAKAKFIEDILSFTSEYEADEKNRNEFIKSFPKNAAMLLVAPAYAETSNGMLPALRESCRVFDEWVPAQEEPPVYLCTAHDRWTIRRYMQKLKRGESISMPWVSPNVLTKRSRNVLEPNENKSNEIDVDQTFGVLLSQSNNDPSNLRPAGKVLPCGHLTEGVFCGYCPPPDVCSSCQRTFSASDMIICVFCGARKAKKQAVDAMQSRSSVMPQVALMQGNNEALMPSTFSMADLFHHTESGLILLTYTHSYLHIHLLIYI